MLKEAIEKIQELAAPFMTQLGDDTFVIGKNGDVIHVHPDLDYAVEIQLYSLDALIQMIKTEAALKYNPPLYIEAFLYDKVKCFLQPDKDLRFYRQYLYTVMAQDIPGWKSEENLGFEQALIAVRTRFQQTKDTEYLLKLLSDITCGAKVTYADNGIATTVTAQKGIALQGMETIRPIITLKPYRTFQEVDQPASEFHIRISERGIRFIESDGGMWKLTARQTIVDYIKEKLATEVEDGHVIVML